ncbi:hypothetical protein FQN57_002680 [Myotisia sp. PD_48]|nr:hypothetical protein FQN57_002680 [Myotisia sp. PD_48]
MRTLQLFVLLFALLVYGNPVKPEARAELAPNDASEILIRTDLAAVNSDNHLRVYFQDFRGGIRETQYEGRWLGGSQNNVIAWGKLHGPISATSQALSRIRVYYLSSDNRLRERAYDAGRGWYDGALNGRNWQVAASSSLASSFIRSGADPHIRVYAQLRDNTIQEFGYDAGHGWRPLANLGRALPGTKIAATSFGASVRVYFQDQNRNLVEKGNDGRGWYNGAFLIRNAPERASIAVTSFGSVSIRVYYTTANNWLVESGWDGRGWYTGSFRQQAIPGSHVSAINWVSGSTVNLRVYFQRGVSRTAVSEAVFDGRTWRAGVAALPPA